MEDSDDHISEFSSMVTPIFFFGFQRINMKINLFIVFFLICRTKFLLVYFYENSVIKIMLPTLYYK